MPTNIGFKHGIYVNELPTAIVPLTQITTPTVALGTAPIHLAQNPAAVNTPVLCSTLAEFVEQFGWSNNFDDFTLCEVAKAHFTLYNVAPVIFINVLNPLINAKQTTAEVTGLAATIRLTQPIILGSIVITSGTDDDAVTLAADDFSAIHDDDGNTVITLTTSGAAKIVDDKANVTFRELDQSALDGSAIIGGVDTMSGANKGLECIEDIYPKLGIVPGTIIAPKFSANAAVAAAMAAKSNGINGCFKAIAIADLPTNSATRYTDVANVKTSNNFADSFLVATWPKVSLGGEQYHLSTQLAALMCVVDAARDNIPFKSPSNETLRCDSAVLMDGTEVYLGKDRANYVNSQGVVTALNFGGWRSWGNHVSAYPYDTDPINFISVRRMLNWINNTLTLTFFSRIDDPMNRVLVDSVLDSVRTWLNGLAKRGAILGGDIAFLEDDNSVTELEAGNMLFRMDVGFAVPAQKIQFTVQFNPNYFTALFE